MLTVSTGFLAIGLILSSQIQNLWQLYIFDGLFIGLSISASFAIPVSLVALWFTRRQGLAVGVATLGVSLGTAVIPLIITYLISEPRMAFHFSPRRDSGRCYMHPFGAFNAKPHCSRKAKFSADSQGQDLSSIKTSPGDSTDTGLSISEALHTRQFWMLFLVFLFFLLSLGLVMLHIVPYAVDSGMTPVQAATLLTLIGYLASAGVLRQD